MKKTYIILIIGLFATAFYNCKKEEDYNPKFPASELIQDGSYNGAYWPTDDWQSCKPEEVGMSSEKLAELNEEIAILLDLHVDIHGVLVIKNGYIVAEQYYSDDYTKDSLHPIYSCTKSITSALMGIAIDQGYIADTEEKLLDFFTEYDIQNMTAEKENITLKHALTMSAGFEWYEMEYSYEDERNSYNQWVQSDNRVKFVLDRPMAAAPGDEFSYNTGLSHLLSAVIQKSTSIRTDSFAITNLFSPIGIKEFSWFIEPHGIPTGGHGMQLKPRDMAKFAYLYMKNGNWNGKQVVPESWVTESTKPWIQRKYIPEFYYGFQWWVKPENYYVAVGYSGQWIYVVPDLDLIVVFTNAYDEEDYLQRSMPERLMNAYILPAVN